jgi:uncharacterized protein (TIGR00730 family)
MGRIAKRQAAGDKRAHRPRATIMQKRNPNGSGSGHGLSNICVYCGSGKGRTRAYAGAARTLGRALAKSGIGLVYGGGSLGLMGELAHATLKHGGRVTGIIPSFLSAQEKMLKEADELIVTDTMHQRKMLMFERSDAFVALPGGVGTLEELVEQLTWSQLGRHSKPIIVANIEGFWTPFLKLLEHMRAESFIRTGLEINCSVVDTAEKIVPAAVAASRMAIGEAKEAVITRL